MSGSAVESFGHAEREFAEEVTDIVLTIAEAFVSGATELPHSYPTVLQRLFPAAKMLSLAVPGLYDSLLLRGTTVLSTYHRFSILPLERTACGATFVRGQNLHFDVCQAYEDLRDAEYVYQCKSVLCVPIFPKYTLGGHQRVPVGVVMLGVTVPKEDISRGELYHLSCIAQQLGVLLQDAHKRVRYNVEKVWQPLLMQGLGAGGVGGQQGRIQRAAAHSSLLLYFYDGRVEEEFRQFQNRLAMEWDLVWAWAGIAFYVCLAMFAKGSTYMIMFHLLPGLFHVVPVYKRIRTTSQG
eukprot:jgi/Botrbrau1/1899/Bobra.0005s0015.1